MLPPSSTVISSGPRRAVNVAPLLVDLLPGISQSSANRKTAQATTRRQRGCDLINAQILPVTCIGDLLPLAIVLNVQNAQIIPKLEPGDGVADQGLGTLVSGIGEIVLGINLILRPGAP